MIDRKDSVEPRIAHGHMAAPCLQTHIDYSVFMQTSTQRGAAYTEKSRLRKELRFHYGKNWRKHLNTPDKEIGKPIKLTF